MSTMRAILYVAQIQKCQFIQYSILKNKKYSDIIQTQRRTPMYRTIKSKRSKSNRFLKLKSNHMRFQVTEIFINCRFRKETKSTIRSKLENRNTMDILLTGSKPIVFQIFAEVEEQVIFQSKTQHKQMVDKQITKSEGNCFRRRKKKSEVNSNW